MNLPTIDEALKYAHFRKTAGIFLDEADDAAIALADEVQRLQGVLDMIQKANPDRHIAQVYKGPTGAISLKGPDGAPFDVSNWIGAKLRLCHQPMSLLGCWVPVEAFPPALAEDVLVTLLIDGTDTAWKAGYWDGEYWYTLDTEHDEPIQVNAGCNFVVTHWARVVPAVQEVNHGN